MDVANEVSMTRTAFKGTFLLVEGTTDVRLYGKFTSPDTTVIAACSKSNVRNAMKECARRKERRIVGIVDRDIDSMTGVTVNPPVFETDRHDMESMLMCTPALDAVLAEYGDKELLKRFNDNHGSVRDAVGRGAEPICVLMYVSHKKGMNLSFKNLDHRSFINNRTLEPDVRRMVTEVYDASSPQLYTEPIITDLVKALICDIKDPWDAVRGHDAVSVLTIGLRSAFGSYNAKTLSDDAVSGALRLAFSDEEFMKTRLFKDTSKFAEENGLSLWRLTPAP